MKTFLIWVLVLVLLAVLVGGYQQRFLFHVPQFAATNTAIQPPSKSLPEDAEWISLFNGQTLDNWTPKFTGYPPGENYLNTFRVEAGLLSVNYDNYERFAGEFGHLFYQQPFSSYILRLEYRFVGEQADSGPGWAFRNSGVMLHSQPPETIALDADFPVSLEAQLLGGKEKGERPTANLCTPGTHVMLNGELHQYHCTNSLSATLRGEQWVQVEIEMLAASRGRFFVNDQFVFEFSNPQYDPHTASAAALITDSKVQLGEGYIALQAESHPVQFRNIELHVLNP